MQRNIISERLLAMPREYAADKDRPFDEVRHNASPSRPRDGARAGRSRRPAGQRMTPLILSSNSASWS